MTTASLQRIRRTNLRLLIDQLVADGVTTEQEQAQLLGGLRGQELNALLQGAPISDSAAREMEWGTHRPVHWMDQTHDPLTAG